MYEERVRALEEAIASRDRTLGQLRDSLLQADVEYKKVGALGDMVLLARHGTHRWWWKGGTDVGARMEPDGKYNTRANADAALVSTQTAFSWTRHPTWKRTLVLSMVLVLPFPVPLQSLQALVSEVQAKTGALLEAERRFAELESVMQRAVARSAAL